MKVVCRMMSSVKHSQLPQWTRVFVRACHAYPTQGTLLHARLDGGSSCAAQEAAAAVALPAKQVMLRPATPPPQVALHAPQAPGAQCGAAQSGAAQPRDSCMPTKTAGLTLCTKGTNRV